MYSPIHHSRCETWQIYGIDGELLAEYPANGSAGAPQKEYGYRNGQLLITASSTVSADQSLSLNGTTAYMQVPNSSSLNITGAITVEAWVRPTSIGSYQYIASRESYAQSGTGGGYELSLNNVGKARFDLYHSPTTYTPVIGNTVLSTGTWHHVAGVWDGSFMRLYVDGVLDATVNSGNAPAPGTSTLKIGRNSGGNYLSGLIDEVRVSNVALYSSNFTPQAHLTGSSSTKGLWKFDNQNTADSSGNGNTGTLQGSGAYSSNVPGSGGGASQIQWLVVDQLGTPRMIVDQAGTLASVKRHDYLPFGEEIYANVGGRTTALGYTTGDGVRQQFTAQERDNESGLDYFGSRYYMSAQGRFTSGDPLMASAKTGNPQTWNRYAYVLNNPLRYIDPSGEDAADPVILFQKFGTVKLLNKSLTVYVPATATQEEKEKALKHYQDAADVINAKADQLTKTEKATIGTINALVALPKGVEHNQTFYAKGIDRIGWDDNHNEGVDTVTGTIFFTKAMLENPSAHVASDIGHEGKHVLDYRTQSGAEDPRLLGRTSPIARSNLGERRADRFQLSLYRKLKGLKPTEDDYLTRALKEDIKRTHFGPNIWK